jgi:NAD(P)-dependent dehydrogenase (short-subunit alcohol dehydrogenase family)
LDLQLADDVAVVIGGARGIGHAIAQAFAAERARVVIVDRDREAPNIAAHMGQADRHLGVVADVTDYAALESAREEVMRRYGRIDHVVCAAAVGSGKFGFPFWNLTPADWPRVLNVTLLGAVHTAHAFAPPLVEARRGTMLFISSVAGQIGSQTDPPYSAAKAAVINFAQVVAKDFASYGVRANVICPGMIKTTLNRAVWEAWNAQQPEGERRSYEDWADEKVGRVVPLGRWQEPEDIARMAVFLASPCAANVTGQTINVDGGWVMHA